MTSMNSWQSLLSQNLNQLHNNLQLPQEQIRLAIVGIGNELRGDDAAGVAVVRRLAQDTLIRQKKNKNVLLIDAGNAPENYTGPLRRFAPHLVLLVDMAQMDCVPGSVRWLPWQETSGLSASSHTMPPYMLAQFLTADLHCEVALIGVQPLDTSLTMSMSPVVETAVDSVVSELSAIINRFYP